MQTFKTVCKGNYQLNKLNALKRIEMKTTLKIKTIDVQAKEWFDKVYGNSYFSANLTINFGLKNQKNIFLPFQYGYGSHYIDIAGQELLKLKLVKKDDNNTFFSLWRYCKDNKIILRTSKRENCLKRELKY